MIFILSQNISADLKRSKLKNVQPVVEFYIGISE